MKTNILIFKVVLIEIVAIVAFVALNNKYHFFDSDKERLDRIVGTYWYDWKNAGKDTTNCILDFENIMPFEWDTLVYVDHVFTPVEPNKEFDEYIDTRYPEARVNDFILRLHFLRKGKIVHDVNLYMVSDDAKGAYFRTHKYFIKRGRKDAKFHLVRDCNFFVIRDMTEELVPMQYGF